MSSGEKKIKKIDKKFHCSPQNKLRRSYEKIQSELLFYIENNNHPKSFRNENFKKLSPNYYEIFQQNFIEKNNHNANFSPTLDLKNLSTKIKSQFKKPLKNTKNNLDKTNNNSNYNCSKNQIYNINTSKKLPKKALEGIKILQHLIKFNLKFLKNKKDNTNEKLEKEKNKINMINIKHKKDEKENKKINQKEQIYKKIKLQKKEENLNKRNYRSLRRERDKRKAIHNIINEDNTISLNKLNLKLNSLMKKYNSLKCLNNSLDLKTKLSKSVSDFDLSNCDKLINKIRCQKKLYEILYNIEKKV